MIKLKYDSIKSCDPLWSREGLEGVKLSFKIKVRIHVNERNVIELLEGNLDGSVNRTRGNKPHDSYIYTSIGGNVLKGIF